MKALSIAFRVLQTPFVFIAFSLAALVLAAFFTHHLICRPLGSSWRQYIQP